MNKKMVLSIIFFSVLVSVFLIDWSCTEHTNTNNEGVKVKFTLSGFEYLNYQLGDNYAITTDDEVFYIYYKNDFGFEWISECTSWNNLLNHSLIKNGELTDDVYIVLDYVSKENQLFEYWGMLNPPLEGYEYNEWALLSYY